MNLQSASLMSGSPETSLRVGNAVDELDRVIRDLRNYIFGLRPGILADRQLNQALEALGQEVASSSRMPIAVEVDGAVSAALSSRSHEIVQMTREALSNITRHSKSKRAAVRLTRRAANAVLTIEDEGIGFNPREPSMGSGLRNMRERAAAIGGTLRITSANGKGTTLRFTFPVDALGPIGPILKGPPTIGAPVTP
jgi:signal transduction histidine kinase